MIKYAFIYEKSKEYNLKYNILLVGATGAGKSSTINALYEFYSGKHEAIPTQYAKVGDSVAPETMEITKYPMFPYLNIWDSPGLGDGKANDEMHHQKIAAFLKNTDIDLIMVIVDGSGRDLGTIYNVLNKIILPNYYIKENVVILVNQADMAMKGRNWNKEYNIPNAELQDFLNNQVISVQQRIKEATRLSVNSIIHYSAEKKFNLNGIANLIYNNILLKIHISEEIKAEREKKEKEKQEKLRQAEIAHLETEQLGAFFLIVMSVIALLCFYYNFNNIAYSLIIFIIIIYWICGVEDLGIEDIFFPIIFVSVIVCSCFYFDFDIFRLFGQLLFIALAVALLLECRKIYFGLFLFIFSIISFFFNFDKTGYFILWCLIVIATIYLVFLLYRIKDKK